MGGTFVEILCAGMIAGFGIAIAAVHIGLLVADAGRRFGFAGGLFAGLGVALADLVYATVAVVVGESLAASLELHGGSLQIICGVVLCVIASYGAWRGLRGAASPSATRVVAESGRRWGSLRRLFVITAMDPFTIVYYAAVSLPSGARDGAPLLAGASFVAGVTVASLSWQVVCARAGAATGRALSPRAQRWLGIVGSLVILGIGLRYFIAASCR